MPSDLTVLPRDVKLRKYAELLRAEKERRLRGDPLPSPWSQYREDPVGFFTGPLNYYIWSKQRDICQALVDHDRVAVKSCHESGKALALDTPLPTSSGWTTMGEVAAGDELIDESGKSCRVVACSSTEIRKCYRVIFDDGTSIVAADNHQWVAMNYDERHRYRMRHYGVLNDWRDWWKYARIHITEEFAREQRHRGRVSANWSIPTARPLEGRKSDFPIPGYTLGYWLGDGTTSAGSFCTGTGDAPEVLASIEADGFVLDPHKSKIGTSCPSFRVIGLRALLKSTGLLNNKHVPAAILRADFDTRLACLQGLMDSDGSTGLKDRKNSAGICVTDKKLADGIAELIATFGWKVRRREKRVVSRKLDRCVAYSMNFRPDLPVFRLSRKLSHCRGTTAEQAARHTQRFVISVEPAGELPVRCVEVDSPSHMYLAGPGFVPTHNSFTAGGLVGWWIAVHPPGEAIVVTTAPTFPQVRAILWREVNRVHARGKLPGHTNQTEWLINNELVAFGRKPDDNSPAAFQGLHARYMLVVLDEACGVPANLWNAAETLVANEGGKILAIGNPDDPNTEFGRVCRPGSDYHVITVSAFSTPNLTDEDVPEDLRRRLIGAAWVERMRRRHGETSAYYQSKVLGEFPEVSHDSLIAPRLVTDAVNRELPAEGANELGVDVARFGRNETVIYHRRGPVARLWRAENKRDTMYVAGLVIQAVVDTGATAVKVDDAGLGGGVVDRLNEVKRDGTIVPNPLANCRVIGVNVGRAPIERASDRVARPVVARDRREQAKSDPRMRFRNLKAQLSFELANLFVAGEIDLDPEDVDCHAQICEIRYDVNSQGQVVIESKEEVEDRLRKLEGATGESGSPDRWDALVLAFADVEARPPVTISPAFLARAKMRRR